MIDRWAGKKEGWLCVIHIKQLLLSAYNTAGFDPDTGCGMHKAAGEGEGAGSQISENTQQTITR